MTIFAANKYFSEGKYEIAIKLYEALQQTHPQLYELIKVNIKIAKKRLTLGDNFLDIEGEIKKYKDKVTVRSGTGEYKGWLDSRISYENIDLPEIRLKYSGVPKYSILLPVYKVKLDFLKDAIYSVVNQSYKNWELCIAMADDSSIDSIAFLKKIKDYDCRVRVKFLNENGGISLNTNEAFNLSSGNYVCLLDHDDELHLDALMYVDNAMGLGDFDFIYTDKDCVLEDGSLRVNPLFKPKYSPEILFSANYLTHFNVVNRNALNRVGLWDIETDGAQDWDIFWRVLDSSTQSLHVPKVCYHWRIHSNSTSTGLESKPYVISSQIKTIKKHLERKGLKAEVFQNSHGGYKLKWDNLLNRKYNVACLIHGSIDRNLSDAIAYFENVSLEIKDRYNFTICVCDELDLVPKIQKLSDGNFDALLCIAGVVIEYTSSDIMENIDWVINSKGLAFSSSIIIDFNEQIISGGVIFTDKLTPVYLFNGANIYEYGPFGSMLWFRNWRAISSGFCAFNGAIKYSEFIVNAEINSQECFLFFCLSLYNLGYRGLTNPNSRVKSCENIVNYSIPSDATFEFEPYYNVNLSAENLPKLRLVKPQPIHLRPASPKIVDKYSEDAIQLAKYFDCSQFDINSNMPKNLSFGYNPIDARIMNWYLPSFSSIYYGGIMTIMRLAFYLYVNKGISSNFIIMDKVDSADVSKQICGAFFDFKFTVSTIFDYPSLAAVPDADYSVATLWTTAYTVLKIKNTRIKIYMIQDWEPLFYPAGSTMAQVELTYKFRFYGIANTISLKNLYDNFGLNKTVVLSPAVDLNLFNPPLNNKRPQSSPKKLFYYARPDTPRNCFEIAINALKIVKSTLGSDVEILCAGANWDPNDFDLGDKITCLGMLPFKKTAQLYKTVHVGLALMMTKHPSYLPFELMASGVLLVGLKNEACDWLLKDNINCLLSEPSVTCLSDKIIDALLNYDTYKDIMKNGVHTISSNHSSWSNSFNSVSQFLELIY